VTCRFTGAFPNSLIAGKEYVAHSPPGRPPARSFSHFASGHGGIILDDRPVLFSESAQKIYELNQIAAFIWCRLLDRKPEEAICDDLTKFGLGRVAARNHLHQALRSWFKLGLLEIDWGLSENHSFAVCVGCLRSIFRRRANG